MIPRSSEIVNQHRGRRPWNPRVNGTRLSKSERDIILSAPPGPPTYRVGVAAVASHFSARASRVGRWQCTGGLAPDTPYVCLRSPGEFCCTRRQSSDIGSRNYSHWYSAIVPGTWPIAGFFFLLIYLFSIKVNGRRRGGGRRDFLPHCRHLSISETSREHVEGSAASLSRVASSDIINFSLLDNSSDKSPKRECLVDKPRRFPDCHRANRNGTSQLDIYICTRRNYNRNVVILITYDLDSLHFFKWKLLAAE